MTIKSSPDDRRYRQSIMSLLVLPVLFDLLSGMITSERNLLKYRLWFLVLCIVVLYGCTYPVATRIQPVANFHFLYKDKIPGSVVLVIDDDIMNISRKVKASSCACSAHTFPFRMGDSLALSIRSATERVFETVVEESEFLSAEQFAAANNSGFIYVKLNKFNPLIRFSSGFWGSSAHASADLVLDVTVRNASNADLMVVSISGSGQAEGEAGGSCGGMANVLSEAISQTVRDSVKRYAERLANSEMIRTTFARSPEHRAAKKK